MQKRRKNMKYEKWDSEKVRYKAYRSTTDTELSLHMKVQWIISDYNPATIVALVILSWSLLRVSSYIVLIY